MNARITSKQDTKQLLIEAGMQAMLERGYSNTGIQEVLNMVGVPKGSFYHYFESKEHFALHIIRYYDEKFSAHLNRVLNDRSLSPMQRLRKYCEEKKDIIGAWGCCKGCLVGNLSQEMSDQSEILRTELSSVMSKWRHAFATCIAEGQTTGEIKHQPDAQSIAELFLDGWEGAVMRAKTMKSLQPLDLFMDLMFKFVLKS